MSSKTKLSVVLTKDGAEHIYVIEATPEFNAAAIQIVGATGGANSIVLEGAVAGDTYVSVGELPSGVISTLVTDGLLFYRKALPLKLRVRYTLTAGVGDCTLHVVVMKEPRSSVLAY